MQLCIEIKILKVRIIAHKYLLSKFDCPGPRLSSDQQPHHPH